MQHAYQPVPELNFAEELNTLLPHPAHWNVPSLYSCKGQGGAVSVPLLVAVDHEYQVGQPETAGDDLVQRATERQLCASSPQHAVLRWRQQLPPFLLAVHD
jgi:hypothetical protein